VSAQQMPQLHHMTARLAARAGMRPPRLFVSPSPQPNAFATGRNEATAAVCVTEGLLRTLDWGEIEGVLAHELAHIRHRDILIGSVAAAVAMAITFAAAMARFALIFAGGDGRRDNPLSALLMVLLAPVAAALIQASISRSREFEADAAAAAMLGSGAPLASALTKLERFSSVPSGVNPAEASAYIVNPLAGVSMARWFSTHPPTAERVARLAAL
jgi:heat shock protein HtpX